MQTHALRAKLLSSGMRFLQKKFHIGVYKFYICFYMFYIYVFIDFMYVFISFMYVLLSSTNYA